MIEPYRMIEARTFSDDELKAIPQRDVPSLDDVLWYAVWYVFCMLVTYLAILIMTW